MQNMTFTAPFKPSGADYTRLCMWNRYVHNKLRLFVTLLPCVFGIYFLYKNTVPYFIPIYILLICYPLIHVTAFYFKIKKHLRFRSKADTAMATFTIMDNGILTERPEVELNKLFHWNDFTKIIDYSNFLLLYNNAMLTLVLPKDAMTKNSPSEIRDYIAARIYTKQKEASNA